MRHIQALWRHYSIESKSDIFGTPRNPCIYNRDTSSSSSKHFQGYFRHSQGYSCIFSHIYRGSTRVRGEASPALFENRKKCLEFWKKGPDYIHLSVKFSIQNVALRVGEKTPKYFLAGPFFLMFLTKSLSKCCSFTNVP